MYRLRTEARKSLIVKKSEFIAMLFRVNDEDEVKEYLKAIRKQHPRARHVCHAVIIHGEKDIERSNDDGEPAGTAGLPMLELLRKREIENVLAVVVRYFGGILLGSGGLIRAYSQSIAQCLDDTELNEMTTVLQSTISFPLRFADPIFHLLRNKTMLSETFGENVTVTLLSKDDSWKEACQALCSGDFLILEQKTTSMETHLNPR
jgi:uncharacterized YigZ family protein